MNLKLDLNLATALPILRKAQPYVFGLALIGVFGYTAYVVNAALNTQPQTAVPVSTATATKITFDKTTISKLKQLSSVSGDVPTGDLGSSDPFR